MIPKLEGESFEKARGGCVSIAGCWFVSRSMPGAAAAGEPTISEDGGSHAHGKGQGPDGRWMLKLIYPNAVSLESYLEAWLRSIAEAATPGSASAAAIDSSGGPANYLSREDDGAEFKKVGRCAVVSAGS